MGDATLPQTVSATDAHWHQDERNAELLLCYESLCAENRRLRPENVDLSRLLATVESGNQANLDLRRAALNLMEDAVCSKQAEQRENVERRRAEAELREADRRKDEFLATLAHELRNPLAPIRNSLHLLQLTGAIDGSSQPIHAMLDRQVTHLVRLVDDLLDVARISRGSIQLRMEQLDLSDIVRTAVEASLPFVESAHHRLEVSLPNEPVPLLGDAVRLSQIITNLLNNAAKYTNDGGQIWLTASQEGQQAIVSVRDTGMGIRSDMLPKVFDMFTQVDRTSKQSLSGLGIGLTLARRLAEMHAGTVQVHSDGPGRGSEFTVQLPVTATESSRRVDGPHFTLSSSTASLKVLVVDDNRDAAASLAKLLEFLGADVTTANNGKAALAQFHTHLPSVVFLDIGMPDMDGHEVARRLRRLPEGRAVTLVALTGWSQDADRCLTQESGFDQHLVKPIDLSVLQAVLAAASAC